MKLMRQEVRQNFDLSPLIFSAYVQESMVKPKEKVKKAIKIKGENRIPYALLMRECCTCKKRE